jgi:predicted  nucleic acid-binding Zn-ribbon protein
MQTPVQQVTTQLAKARQQSMLISQGEKLAARELDLSRLTTRMGRLTSEIGELSEALAQAEHRADKLSRESLRYQSHASRLEQQICDRKLHIAELEQKLARVRKVLAELRTGRGQQGQGNTGQATEIAGLMERNGQLTTSRKHLENQ